MSRLFSLFVWCIACLFALAYADVAAAQESDSDDSERIAPQDDEDSPWAFGFGGYVRTQYTAIENDPNFDQFGRRDGFQIADARLQFRGGMDNGLGFEVSIDAGTLRPSEQANTAMGEMTTRLKDGYLYYEPHPLLRASAGQFKVPFDLEELISTANMLFIERSVGNRGVRAIEGPNRRGLTEGRQVGLRLDSDPYFFLEDDDGPGVSYGLALTNGVAANQAFNDNDKLAYFGRLNLHWGDLVRVGAATFTNEQTLGEPPDQLGEDRAGWTTDLLVKVAGLSVLANVIEVDITPSPELDDEQERTARAYQAQLAYEEPFIGLQPAYRISHYDPATAEEFEGNRRAFEALTYHTIGLNYNARTYPVRLMVNYTLTGEEERDIDNDRFDALVQLHW